MIDFDVKSYLNATSVLPDGEYNFRVKNTKMQPTKAGDGSRFLSITLAVLDGARKGVWVSDMFNIYNTSEQCQEIGRKKFAAFCDALGIDPKAYHELEGGLVRAKISSEIYNGKDKNKVDEYMHLPVGDFQEPELKEEDVFNDKIPF